MLLLLNSLRVITSWIAHESCSSYMSSVPTGTWLSVFSSAMSPLPPPRILLTKLYDNARIDEASTWISAGKSRRYSNSVDDTATVSLSIFPPLLQLFLSPTFLTGLLGCLVLVLLPETTPDQNTLPNAWHQEMFDPRWPRRLAATNNIAYSDF